MDLKIQQSKSQPLLNACNGIISNLDNLVNQIGNLDQTQREFYINKITESGRLLEDLALHHRLDISEKITNKKISNKKIIQKQVKVIIPTVSLLPKLPPIPTTFDPNIRKLFC